MSAPRVTGSPHVIWLVYGELEHDDTHANCADSGEVTWCEDSQFDSDVRYVRADKADAVRDELLAALQAADYAMQCSGLLACHAARKQIAAAIARATGEAA